MKKDIFFVIEHFIAKYRLVFTLVAAVLLLALPFLGLSQFAIRTWIIIGIFSMLALGLNLLTGYAGQVSLGHAGFVAIGAYTSSLLMLRFNVPFFVALIAATLLSGIVGLLLGLPTMRLSGNYLTIVTLGFGEIIRLVIMTWTPVTNGTLGLMNIPRPTWFGTPLTLANNGLYYLMLALVALAFLACHAIVRSKTGRAFLAIREDAIAARMMGIRIPRYKMLAFILSAAITGMAGAFYSSVLGFIDHNSFDFNVSILILSVIIVGGIGTLRGMFLGAAVLIVFPEASRFLMAYRFVVYGLLLILMMHFRPQGLLGWKSRLPVKLPKGGDI